MAVRVLDRSLWFPAPETAEPDGLLAIGGDVRPERLLLAYSQGIFPWPSPGLPLLWFCPDPRFLLFLRNFHIGRSLRKAIRQGGFEVKADLRFRDVITQCQRAPRPGQDGSWITDELVEGYTALHEEGFAHSIETYLDGELVGGLYGVSLGSAFFGESMFATRSNASRVALVCLSASLVSWGFEWMDCQMETELFQRVGARFVGRSDFLDRLRHATARRTRSGPWQLVYSPTQAVDFLGRSALPSDADGNA